MFEHDLWATVYFYMPGRNQEPEFQVSEVYASGDDAHIPSSAFTCGNYHAVEYGGKVGEWQFRPAQNDERLPDPGWLDAHKPSVKQWFIVGETYPMTMQEGRNILRQAGLAAILAAGVPDVTRGRRRTGERPDAWEFWMTSGQKISFSVRLGSGVNDHFILSVSNGPDPDRPRPQFPYEPTRCINPECYNLVAPVGTEPAPGHFKNYRGTGACRKGHNAYFCTVCKAPHSYVSGIGKEHYEAGLAAG